jgi:hypothetical protein
MEVNAEGQEDLRLIFQLSGKQRVLYDALCERDTQLANETGKKLADMYLGALRALADEHNPDRLSLAAHGIRELMEKLARYLDVPTKTASPLKKPPSLKEKVQRLHDGWKLTMSQSGCYTEVDDGWQGFIDNHLLQFLRQTKNFFAWVENERPSKNQQTLAIMRQLDSTSLPSTILQLRVEEWSYYQNYFTEVAHHSIESLHEFHTCLSALEQFLFERLRPQTFDVSPKAASIRQIIKEGETNA